jgi:phosphoglycolate phosphatase
MKPTVVLFDIDGTLVSTGGAGRRAIDIAFDKHFGRADACRDFSFDGMTDPAIVRQGLTTIGVQPTSTIMAAVLATYIEALAGAIADTPPERYIVHPGVREAVAECVQRGFAVGLGTGNVLSGARLKLDRIGLYAPFSFGGFGDDSELRPELIRVGAERGAARLGVSLAEARVVIVGDTPKDVAAAQAIGAECVGVGTGRHTADDLRRAGATWAYSHLAAADSSRWLEETAR